MALMLALSAMPCFASEKEDQCEVVLPVQIEITGDSAPAKERFEVSITSKDANTPMPEVTTKTVEGAGQISFGPIDYKLPEDYHYVITQKKGTASPWTYDQTVYEVTVRIVNDQDGMLNAEVWAVRAGSGQKSDQIRFTNRYDAPEIYEAPKIYVTPTAISPHTGDTAVIGIYAGLMGVSLIALLTVFRKGYGHFAHRIKWKKEL